MDKIIERLRKMREEIEAARMADEEAKNALLENANASRAAMDNAKTAEEYAFEKAKAEFYDREYAKAKREKTKPHYTIDDAKGLFNEIVRTRANKLLPLNERLIAISNEITEIAKEMTAIRNQSGNALNIHRSFILPGDINKCTSALNYELNIDGIKIAASQLSYFVKTNKEVLNSQAKR